MFTNTKTGQTARLARDLWLMILLAAVVACQKPRVSTYMVAKQDLVVERPEGLDAWQVPEGWLGRLSITPTVATFRVFNNAPQGNATHPAGGSATVMVVKLTGSAGDLQLNMARWARQVGLEPPVGDEVVKALSTVEIDGRTANRIRFKNPADGRALLVDWIETEGFSWFFKISGDTTVVEHSIPAMNAFTASIQFSAKENPLPGVAAWEVPPGWEPGSPGQFVMFSFVIPGNPANLKLTVARAGGDLNAQFDRWARIMQLKMPADPVKEWVAPIEVNGRSSHLVEMHNPELGFRMKLVMVPGGAGKESWFFTVRGHDEAVAAKGGEFHAFIKSIKFAKDGAGN